MNAIPSRSIALVTAGSTVGRLDALRHTEQIDYESAPGFETRQLFDSQNPFKGKLGLHIAQVLSRRGMGVVLLARKDLLAGEEIALPPGALRPFFTFGELEEALPRALTESRPSVVFMSAAVSDFVPVSIEGVSESARSAKISSALPELIVRYRATPKLIDRIAPAVDPGSTIVGFKLIVGLSEDEQKGLAMRQMERANSSFCVVNDYLELGRDLSVHPCRLVARSGEVVRITGSKVEVAEEIVDRVLSFHDKRGS